MAKPWKEVIASPNYQSLSSEQKAAAQEQYFNEVVAPQVGENVDQAKQQFYSAYPIGKPQLSDAQMANLDIPTDEILAYHDAKKPKQTPQENGVLEDIGEGLLETAKATAQAGVNLANIPADIGDAFVSAGAWAGEKAGLGDGTYTPSSRFSLPEDMKPQTSEGKVFSQALPFLVNPSGAAPRGAALSERAARMLSENVVGVMAENAGKNGQGDLGQELGTATALSAATRGLFNLAGAGYRGVRGAMSPEAREAVEFAERNNAPLMTTDVVPVERNWFANSARALSEKIPVAGTGAARRTQQARRSELVDEYVQRFGRPNHDEIIASLNRKVGRDGYIRAAAGNRLNTIVDDMNQLGNISPQRAVNALDNEINHLSRLRNVSDDETIQQLRAYRYEFHAGGDFQLLRDLRTSFRQRVRGERTNLPTQSDASIERVYRAITQDLNNLVRSSLGDNVARRYHQSDAIYAREAANINNTRLKNVLNKGDLTPEVANNLLFSNKPSEVARLYSSLDNHGRQTARTAIIGKAYEQSGGSPDKFLNAVNKLSNQTRIFFRGDERRYLNGLTRYLDSTRHASKAGAVTPTGQELMQLAVPTGIYYGGTTGLAAGMGYGTLARIYESPKVRNFMLRLANTPRGSTAGDRLINQIRQAIEPMIQGERADALRK